MNKNTLITAHKHCLEIRIALTYIGMNYLQETGYF